jgi:hypothetical protein
VYFDDLNLINTVVEKQDAVTIEQLNAGASVTSSGPAYRGHHFASGTGLVRVVRS